MFGFHQSCRVENFLTTLAPSICVDKKKRCAENLQTATKLHT